VLPGSGLLALCSAASYWRRSSAVSSISPYGTRTTRNLSSAATAASRLDAVVVADAYETPGPDDEQARRSRLLLRDEWSSLRTPRRRPPRCRYGRRGAARRERRRCATALSR
jgi:hypothetical protein